MRKNKETGLYLKKYRKKNNLSQEAVAKELNVTRTLISKWENGEVVNKEYRKKLASILKINPILIDCNGNKFKYCKMFLKRNIIIFLLFLLVLVIILLSVFSFKVLKFYFANKDNEIAYQELIVNNNEYFELYNSSIFTSNVRVFLRLNIKYKVEDSLIDRIKFGYFIDDQKYYAFDSEPRMFFSFEDHQYEQNSIKFDYINEIVDNLFIELELKDGKIEMIPLISNELYSSKELFIKLDEAPIINEIDNNYPKSQLYDKLIQLGKKNRNNGERINFKYKEYDISFFILDIEYFFEIKNKSEYYQLSYINAGAEYIDKYNLNKQEKLYSYSLTTDECDNHNAKIDYCKDKNKDIMLLNDIVDFALNTDIN